MSAPDRRHQAQGRAVRHYRLSAKLSMQALSDALRVKLQFISNIEHGISGIPPTRLNDFALTLAAPPELLLSAKLYDHEVQMRRESSLAWPPSLHAVEAMLTQALPLGTSKGRAS